ncbi:hypothetical protein R4Z10_01275 [Niallia sp. XMNu-256]|uniref:hypothetical protein n=1 Tax=Niallia sp. XMNu-256 TaxID=3082444 RepID=UPI0030CAFA06
MRKILPLFGFIIVIMMMIYLDSPYSLLNKEYVEVTSIPNEVILAKVEALEEVSETVSSDSKENEGAENLEEVEKAFADYTLEMLLEEKTVDGDYIIEEYREYEVYRGLDGEIIKSVPTSNFDYLRYYNKQ